MDLVERRLISDAARPSDGSGTIDIPMDYTPAQQTARASTRDVMRNTGDDVVYATACILESSIKLSRILDLYPEASTGSDTPAQPARELPYTVALQIQELENRPARLAENIGLDPAAFDEALTVAEHMFVTIEAFPQLPFDFESSLALHRGLGQLSVLSDQPLVFDEGNS